MEANTEKKGKGGKGLLISSVVLLLLAGVGYGVYWWLGKKNVAPPKKDDTPSNDKEVINITASNDNFPLKQGSKGERVKLLQKFINLTAKTLRYDIKIGEDGKFGPGTEAALYKIEKVKEVDRPLWNKTALFYKRPDLVV